LRDCFDIVVSSLDVLNPKPHPESLFRILDHLHLSSDQGLYIGDSMVDAQTAAAAGVPFVAYKNNALEADYHVHHLLEVAELVGAGHEDG
jgi:phosphoglycolate phosphatase